MADDRPLASSWGVQKALLTDEALMGIRKPDLSMMKALKIKLPLSHVLALHRLRIVSDQSVSDIVAQALLEYIDGLRNRAAASMPALVH